MMIYFSARYSRRVELCGYRDDIESQGYMITSRWLAGGHELTREGTSDEVTCARAEYAKEDFDDLIRADVCITFTEEPRSTATRGGRHVEFGIALALIKHCVVIGPRENVFHCLPIVEWYPDWKSFRESRWFKKT